MSPASRGDAKQPPGPGPLATYGTPQDLSALQALQAELARTAGAVEWLREQVARLTPDQLVRGTRFVRRTDGTRGTATVTEVGSARHELLRLYMEERRHLHALCRDIIGGPETPAARLLREAAVRDALDE